ncbi:MAG: hypothetical protein NDF55_00250 [archaeon GB-1867-005]|nr:hypothetical protein [Candidatus Culexmicrobium cathedralense]
MKGYKIPCPWLKKEGDKYYCTASTPPIEVDIRKEICKLPQSPFDPTRPYSMCRRWRPP